MNAKFEKIRIVLPESIATVLPAGAVVLAGYKMSLLARRIN
jgi:hypothetical protein